MLQKRDITVVEVLPGTDTSSDSDSVMSRYTDALHLSSC